MPKNREELDNAVNRIIQENASEQRTQDQAKESSARESEEGAESDPTRFLKGGEGEHFTFVVPKAAILEHLHSTDKVGRKTVEVDVLKITALREPKVQTEAKVLPYPMLAPRYRPRRRAARDVLFCYVLSSLFSQ